MEVQALDVFIEIPQGSYVKYELDKKLGSIRADRILAVPYPFHYGFIPSTLWADGDPLDVILIGDFSLHPGVIMKVYPRQAIQLKDNGQSDDKIICTARPDEPYDFMMPIILDFLKTYKTGIEIQNIISDLELIQNAIRGAEIEHNSVRVGT